MYPDRRLMPRYEVALPIAVGPARGITRNVSLSGVRFVMPERIEVDETIAFSFAFPAGLMEVPVVVNCRGTVVRVSPTAEGGCDVTASIDFLRLDASNTNAELIGAASALLRAPTGAYER